MDAIDKLFLKNSQKISIEFHPRVGGITICFGTRQPSQETWDPVQRLTDSGHFLFTESTKTRIANGDRSTILIYKNSVISVEDVVQALVEIWGDRAEILPSTEKATQTLYRICGTNLYDDLDDDHCKFTTDEEKLIQYQAEMQEKYDFVEVVAIATGKNINVWSPFQEVNLSKETELK